MGRRASLAQTRPKANVQGVKFGQDGAKAKPLPMTETPVPLLSAGESDDDLTTASWSYTATVPGTTS